jgi:hypothetical protein
MQKPGNNAKAFGSSSQVVHKSRELKGKVLAYARLGNACTTIMHACDLDNQALGCACGDKTRLVLEQTMLWNGQHSGRALRRY